MGAGIFGFLINTPIVSYFEMGTILTTNHGHAAMFGVFGMLGLGVLVFCLRTMQSDGAWRVTEKYVRVGYWGLNAGLSLMIVLDLFPAGVLQLWDVITNGYWHARQLDYSMSGDVPRSGMDSRRRRHGVHRAGCGSHRLGRAVVLLPGGPVGRADLKTNPPSSFGAVSPRPAGARRRPPSLPSSRLREDRQSAARNASRSALSPSVRFSEKRMS